MRRFSSLVHHDISKRRYNSFAVSIPVQRWWLNFQAWSIIASSGV